MPKVNANGATINYEIMGDGPPVLFIHGSGVSWRMWEPQFEDFSPKFKMIMVDLRGHGESSKDFPGGKYDHFLLAEDMKEFLDAIGEKNVHVVGVSQGAQIGTLLAIHHPAYVNRLVISNSYSEFPSPASKWVLNLSNFIFSLLPYNVILSLMLKVYKEDTYTQEIIRKTISIDKKMMLAMKKAPFPYHTHLLNKIKSPTLIMGGEGKVVTGIYEGKASAIIFDNMHENATLALFKGAFDPLSTMRKELFNEMVIDFLQGKKLKDYQGVIIQSK
ncbi:alpha/beta fold hydrolase [Bacillus methanolicus]|uniref:Alpha/beta hydrolase fold protein n=1 Tax=Bacillus methanolicus (strain MGA3 / ATCC 53907) TaxID=796606 RepID=I3DU62_BACMM|nr:alpha/beta hydrolase [Bacillus methanolicus]AIE61329.1 alpha/beta hydrolase fold protein [Bacillus methanolicus MGA3]EIJ77783.1 alpha/beta superfamily hydrolase/acyltransferase [Bacillus methanolicus MGA3]